MSSEPIHLPHPLTRCALAISHALDEVAGVPTHLVTTTEKQELLVSLTRQSSRIEGLVAVLAADADDVAAVDGSRSVGSWLATHTRGERGASRRLTRLGDRLEDWPTTGGAVLDGRVNIAQAHIITTALDDLPDWIDDTQRDRAEGFMITQAGEHGPRELRVLGEKLLEVIAPDKFEEHQRKLLEAAEKRAQAITQIRTKTMASGMMRAIVDLPAVTMNTWLTQLHAYTSPRRDHLTPDLTPDQTGDETGNDLGAGSEGQGRDRYDPDTGERLPYPQLLGQAFCSMIEHTDLDKLPQHGRGNAALVVTIDWSGLKGEYGTAITATGDVITAEQWRRLACSCGVMPAVLSGKSQVLDFGKARRFFSTGQRTAKTITHTECQTHDCTIPSAWCEAHHWREPWAKGGTTDLEDLMFLCPFHHHRAHDPAYDMRVDGDGGVRFHRRT